MNRKRVLRVMRERSLLVRSWRLHDGRKNGAAWKQRNQIRSGSRT